MSKDRIKKIFETRRLKKMGSDVVIRKKRQGVSPKDVPCEVIVSLTSFPARIETVDKTIRTLLNQTIMPNRLILWLAKEQFPDKERSLPAKLLQLRNNGLEIEWVDKDIKSYKKLIPALQKYPDAIIITVDDDWYYHRDLVKTLMEEHYRNPQMIISNLITHPYFDNSGELHSANNLEPYIGTASFGNKVLGYGGVLYPPKCLSSEVFYDFMHIAPTNDDIWFWSMAVLNNTKIKVPDKPVKMIVMTAPDTQNDQSLSNFNDTYNTYIKDTEAILRKYPEIKFKLLTEI